MKYRKKPIVIEARNSEEIFRYIESCANDEMMNKFIRDADLQYTFYYQTLIVQRMYIITLEGRMEVTRGDYIIRGVKGEYYPCKPDIFLETYESVEDK